MPQAVLALPALRTRSGLEAVLSPTVAFALVCLIYLAFPLNWFNADALHYNLLAYLSDQDPSALWRDRTVSLHALWHVLAMGVVRIVGPETPEHSLYVLRALTIVTALGSIAVFLRLARSEGTDRAAICATVVLAFSHACLRNFLSVEVYALNNLIVMLLLLAVHRALRAPGPISLRRTALLAALLALAISAHVSNLLLALPLLLVVSRGGRRAGLGRCALFAATLAAIGCVALLSLAWASGQGLPAIARLVLDSHPDRAGVYSSPRLLENALTSLASGAAAVAGRHGPWLMLSAGALAAATFLAVRRRTTLFQDPWLRYLGAHLLVMGALVSQWDPSNDEHKVALLPPLLLLAIALHARAAPHLPRAAGAAAALLAGTIFVTGLTDVVLAHRDLRDYLPYRLAAEVHDRSQARDVLLVADERPRRSHGLELAAMTFFGQRVVFLGRNDPDFTRTVEARRAAGFEVLSAPRGGAPVSALDETKAR